MAMIFPDGCGSRNASSVTRYVRHACNSKFNLCVKMTIIKTKCMTNSLIKLIYIIDDMAS